MRRRGAVTGTVRQVQRWRGRIHTARCCGNGKSSQHGNIIGIKQRVPCHRVHATRLCRATIAATQEVGQQATEGGLYARVGAKPQAAQAHRNQAQGAGGAPWCAF